MKHHTSALEVAGLIGLVVLHASLKRYLADGAMVAALFSPGGAHSLLAIFAGLVMIIVRLTLFVGVPGILGSRLAWWAFSRR